MVKQTFLYQKHKELGAKFTEFSGWDMPVQYSSIIEEHNVVRNTAGIFDTSHMGTFIISGNNARIFLDYVTVSDISNLPLYKAKYSMLLNDNGGIKDDIIVYRFENCYMMVVNAGNLDKDFAWLNEHKIENVEIKNISKEICMMAVQGPRAPLLVASLVEDEILSMKYFTAKDVKFKGQAKEASFSKIARTGYTGEDGFEIFISNNCAEYIWSKIIELGVKPCGLGCRDTLRLEACMPLWGHEISEETNPIDTGFIKTVFFNKNFIGKQAIEKIQTTPSKKLVAFICQNGIARTNDEVYMNNKKIGYVTSGSFSPTFKKAIGMALIDISIDETSPIQVKVHNNLRNITIVPKPFYKRGIPSK